MSKIITLRINEVVGSSLCVTSQDGQKIFGQIQQALKDRKNVRLSFQNVESLTPAFLNAGIGQLYGFFDHEYLKKSLSVADMEKDHQALLKSIIETAKLYFKNLAVTAWK